MLATSKRRAASLEQQMKKLEEEWGPEVAKGHGDVPELPPEV
jgi:hypothetical protein